MQNGTLRKRRKRNLAKVTGLSLIPYNESADVVDATYAHQTTKQSHLGPKTTYTSIDMSSDYDNTEEQDGNYNESSHPNFEEQSKNPKVLPYILKTQTLGNLKMLIILGAASGTFPWSWNDKTMRLDSWSDQKLKYWNAFRKIYNVQTFLLTLFQLYAFYLRVTGEQTSYRTVFMASLSVYWYVMGVGWIFCYNTYKDRIRIYINSMLAMNKKYVDSYIISTEECEEGGGLFMKFGIYVNVSQVFASVVLFCVMPYQPWYLFSYIYKDSLPWYTRIPGAIQEFVIVGNTMTGCLLTSWLCISHANSVQFWLRQFHQNNDTGNTKKGLNIRQIAMPMYRSLQILCGLFNECMAPMSIPILKAMVFTGIIPCGYVLIRSMNHLFMEEFPGILTYPIGFIDCYTCGFALLSGSAQMYDMGVSFVDSWSSTKQKLMRRTLKSFPALKVWVGRNYFITVSTTITFFQITFDYIIDCIITFP